MADYHCINVKEAIQIMMLEDPVVFDVRSAAAFQDGSIENAIHLDNANLFEYLNKIDRSRPVIMYCQMGKSSKEAANIFSQHGFQRVYSLDGGYSGWENAHLTAHQHGGGCGCAH